jgi:hypothetical protein
MPIGNFCRYSVSIRKRKVLASGKSRESFNHRHSWIFRGFKTRGTPPGGVRKMPFMNGHDLRNRQMRAIRQQQYKDPEGSPH